MEYDGKNLEQAIDYLINMEEEVRFIYSKALEIENAPWWKRWWLRRKMSKGLAYVCTLWSRLDLAALRYDYLDTVYNHHKELWLMFVLNRVDVETDEDVEDDIQ